MNQEGSFSDDGSTILQSQMELHGNERMPKRSRSVQNKRFSHELILKIFGGIIIAVLLIINIWKFNKEHHHTPSPASQLPAMGMKALPFKKILWVNSYIDFEGQYINEAIPSKQLIQVGKNNGFQVRVVDQITAYQWLSPEIIERIRRAKHNTQVFVHVMDLLRIALLIEHGGITVPVNGYIFADKLDWIEHIMNNRSYLQQMQKKQTLEYCQHVREPEVVLLFSGHGYYRWYEDGIIIARPQSKLMKETFDEMLKVMLDSEWPYDQLHRNEDYSDFDKLVYMGNLFSHAVNLKYHYWNSGNELCHEYGVVSINRGEGTFVKTYGDWIKIAKDFMMDKQRYFKENGRSYLIKFDMGALNSNFMKVILQQDLGDSHENSFFRQLALAQGNKQFMIPPKSRDVKFCIISLKSLPKNNYEKVINDSVLILQSQTFIKWEAVYFIQDLQQQSKVYSQTPLVKLANGSQWEGLNLQRAAVKHCHPDAIGVLLDYDESFQRTDSLRTISERFVDRDVYGAFLTIQDGKRTRQPSQNMAYSRTAMETNVQNIKELALNFRVFSLYAYRLVPHFELYDQFGRYFNRQLPFYTLVMYASYKGQCENQDFKFFLKKVEQKVEIPKIRIYLHDLVIKMPSQKIFDFTPAEYKSKHTVFDWCTSVIQYHHIRMKRHINDYFIYNNGFEFVGLQHRKHLPQIIPKIIHQIWIGTDQLPHNKKVLMDSVRNLHPDYEYMLWTNQNLTKENFPIMHDIVKQMFLFNKVSPTSKFATVADLIRLEIMHKYGGIYIDTNYYVFRKNSLDDWLTFKAVVPAQLVPQFKYLRENGFFACVKGYDRLKPLLDVPLLTSRNFFSREAVLQSGPTYFIQTMQGDAELVEDIYQPPYDFIYPWYAVSEKLNRCDAPYDTPADKLLFKNKGAYWKNCSEIYYYAFGIDFFKEGGSWLRPK